MTEERTQDAKPDTKEIPWRVAFTCGKKQPSYTEIRQDLLKACWGNEKMAHVLYHFIYSGSWKAHNTNIDKSVRVIALQESHAFIIKKLSELKFKVKVSEPTLITYLKLFVAVGYVRKAERKEALEVNFEAIEKAFSNPPVKPVLSKNLNLNLSLNDRCLKEIEMLREEVINLREQVQDLSLTLVGFKFAHAQSEHEFKLNLSSRTKDFKLKKSSESACEDDLEALFFPKKDLLDISKEEDKKEDNCDCAIASSQPPTNQTLSNHSYSQKPEQATLLADSSGYEKPTIQEKKPISKKKISNAEGKQEPALLIPPSMPPEDAEWSPATIRGMFNFWRGHAPLTQGTAVQQNKAANALYQANYTRTQIVSVYEHMCQQSYWIERGGPEIWNVANCIARELKVINKIVPFQKPGKVDVYSLSYQASRPSRLPDMYIPELDDIPQEATN